MSACHGAAASASDFFVIVPYHSGPNGVLEAVIPTMGPCGVVDDRPCNIVLHDRRLRKTGPCHPIGVFKCKAHRSCFTGYPPGHVPYGRKPLALVSPDGAPVAPMSAPVAVRFAGTVFEAALDAAEGRAWRRPTGEEWCPHIDRRRSATGAADRPTWSTQVRHLERVTQLLGLAAPDVDARLAYAEILAIDTLLLHERGGARGYRARGRAAEAVLAAIHARTPADRLAEAGAKAGLWPIPLRFNERTAQLLRRPFRGVGTPRSRAGPSRGLDDP